MNLRWLSICFVAVALTSCKAASRGTDEIAPYGLSAQNTPYVENELAELTIVELEQRAAAGDTLAQAELGARYGKGETVEQDLEKAIEILRDAATKGEPAAEFYLGTAYYSGLGVPHSQVEAVMWFQKASSKGYAPAQYWLAVLIKDGRGGISPNWEAAVPLLWKSATQGHRNAEFLLGYAYQMGVGVEKNPAAAAYWYRRTLSKGYNIRAEFNLALLIKEGSVEWQSGDREALKPLSAEKR